MENSRLEWKKSRIVKNKSYTRILWKEKSNLEQEAQKEAVGSLKCLAAVSCQDIYICSSLKIIWNLITATVIDIQENILNLTKEFPFSEN